MADIVDTATRSRMMRGIRSANTVPEKFIRSLLHRHGYRFRLHVKDLPGKPDIVLPRYNAIVLVNGCFWHGHDCPLFRVPSTRPEFWANKIRKNQENDQRTGTALRDAGWRVATVWECALKGRGALCNDTLSSSLFQWLDTDSARLELSSRYKGYLV